MYRRPEALSWVSASVRLCALKLCCSVSGRAALGTGDDRDAVEDEPDPGQRRDGPDREGDRPRLHRPARRAGHGRGPCHPAPADGPAKAGGAAAAPPSDDGRDHARAHGSAWSSPARLLGRGGPASWRGTPPARRTGRRQRGEGQQQDADRGGSPVQQVQHGYLAVRQRVRDGQGVGGGAGVQQDRRPRAGREVERAGEVVRRASRAASGPSRQFSSMNFSALV